MPLDGAPLRPPRIEGYRIVGPIGQGAMGVVFKAEQLGPRRRVALKVIRGAALVDEAQLRLFEREIQTLARLRHLGHRHHPCLGPHRSWPTRRAPPTS